MTLRSRSKITHVAIRFRGQVYSLPAPHRHHDVLRHIVATLGVDSVDVEDDDEGFLDEDGRYLRRKPALVSAQVNDQIKDPDKIRCGMLFSEDVW